MGIHEQFFKIETDACKKYGEKTLVFIGLNPSKANSTRNDKTLTRIINFSLRWNYKNIYIINLFGLISQSPNQLSKSKRFN